MMNYCNYCEYRENCSLAHNVCFCKDCKDYDDCSIRGVSCDDGHDIECNNGFEEKSLFDDED